MSLITLIGKDPTDMWYERLQDLRDKDDRTYKIRFVFLSILRMLEILSVFVLKTRTDDTRK